MYILNGIAYAGEIKTPIKVCGVRPLDNYRLWLRFTNEETKIFDCNKLIEKKAYTPLKDKEVFNSVYIDYGSIVWQNGDIDIAPEYLYENSMPTNQ